MGKDNECGGCEYYDAEDDRCTAFKCLVLGFLDGCPPLPCEIKNVSCGTKLKNADK